MQRLGQYLFKPASPDRATRLTVRAGFQTEALPELQHELFINRKSSCVVQ
jgi:hypothetical protein